MKILPIRKLWHQLIENAGNGNVANAKVYLNEQNCMGIMYKVWWMLTLASSILIRTSNAYSSVKSSPSVSPATKPNQNEKTVSDENSKNLENHLVPYPEIDTCKMCEQFCNDILEKVGKPFKVDDRVYWPRQNCLGTIKDIPVPNIAWVHFDGQETRDEHGIKLTELELCMEQSERPEGLKSGGSVKKDDNKYDPTMLTIEMVELVSRVRQFGAKKYARNNFKITGFKYTRSLAAALRHIFAYLAGEDNDPESGLSHLGHAICSLEHCIYDSVHHKENDDRKS